MPFVSASARKTTLCRSVIASTTLLVCLFSAPPRQRGAYHSALLPARTTNDPGLGGDPIAQPNYVRYATTLRHWDKSVVTVYVDPAGAATSTEGVVSLISKSLTLWNDRLGSTLRLVATPDPKSADIEVKFAPHGTLAGGAIGRTDVDFTLSDQTLTHATVRLDARLHDAELVQVAAHELGHALGIQGHSPDKRDLMYAYAHLPAEITERDYNTMLVSYNRVNDGNAVDEGSASAWDAANISEEEQDDNAGSE